MNMHAYISTHMHMYVLVKMLENCVLHPHIYSTRIKELNMKVWRPVITHILRIMQSDFNCFHGKEVRILKIHARITRPLSQFEE